MAVSVQITPIYGSHTTSHAVSHLLTIDGFNILLDIGWDISFDHEHLQNLREIAPKVDAVLLSHADVSHLGALPYAFRYLNLNAPVFSTLPVWRMGHMFMYNAYLSRSAQTQFSLFNLDDVDSAFELEDHFHLLKYQQRHPLSAFGGDNVIITPHAAGHMLGGAIWSIQKETETILYAVHFNHRRERHLNPTTLNSFSRPSHLVISATRADSKTESTKPAALVDLIRSTISRSGNVLIPVDTAGRIIELAILLDDIWHNDSFLRSATLVVLHDLSVRTFEFARSMIEWMSDEVVRRFDVSRDNIFDMKHVKLLQSVKQLDQFSKPLVVLASSVSLEVGASRHLFTQWCSQPQNSVILVDRPPPNTLYATLHEHVTKGQNKNSSDDPFQIPITVRRKEYLKGEELQKWRESERLRKAAELEQKRKEEEEQKKEELEALEKANRESAALDSGKADKMDMDDQNRTESGELAGVNSDLVPLGDEEKIIEFMRYYDVRPRRRNLGTFPFQEAPRPTWDEYGQIIDTSCFMIGEDPGEGAPLREAEEKKQADVMNDVDLIREEVPAEYIEEAATLNVACKLHVVDFAGLCDGDSLKRLMKEVEPRHVTLVGGSEEETKHFKQYLEGQIFALGRPQSSGLEGKERSFVVAPRDLESVDITSRTSVCGFSLQDKLISGLRWENVNLSHIAFVDAVVMQERDAGGKQMLTMNGAREDEDSGVMVDVGEKRSVQVGGRGNGDENSGGGHGTLMIGTVMLNQLLDKLSKGGLKAEFAGGALCVQNAETGVVVLVKKTAAQRIALEGAFSEEYVKIRDLLYEELIIPR